MRASDHLWGQIEAHCMSGEMKCFAAAYAQSVACSERAQRIQCAARRLRALERASPIPAARCAALRSCGRYRHASAQGRGEYRCHRAERACATCTYGAKDLGARDAHVQAWCALCGLRAHRPPLQDAAAPGAIYLSHSGPKSPPSIARAAPNASPPTARR
eukprot:7379485-Prymnesium_polylepis.3